MLIGSRETFDSLRKINFKSNFNKSIVFNLFKNVDPIIFSKNSQNYYSILNFKPFNQINNNRNVFKFQIQKQFSIHSQLILNRSFASSPGIQSPQDRLVRFGLIVGGGTLLLYLAGGVFLSFIKWLTIGIAGIFLVRSARHWFLRYSLREPWKEAKNIMENDSGLSKLGFQVPPIWQTKFRKMTTREQFENQGNPINVEGYRWLTPMTILFENGQKADSSIVSEAELEPNQKKYLLTRIYCQQPKMLIYDFGRVNPLQNGKKNDTFHASQEYYIPRASTTAQPEKINNEEIPDAEIVNDSSSNKKRLK